MSKTTKSDEYVNPETGEMEEVPDTWAKKAKTPSPSGPTVPTVANVPDGPDDSWESASALIWRPEKGSVLQGVYTDVEPFTEGTLDTEVNKHYIKDNAGITYSFVGGSVFDKAMARAKIQPGYRIRVTYLGQADCKAGRVNLFDIKYKKA